jgi:catechol 2,3-dioxygenase-like lactoylglutathione lyase family enzyme
MDPRISLVTLGVTDMKKSRTFYEALGFTAGAPSNDDVTFFQAGGMILGLYGRAALAADAGIEDGIDNDRPGFSGVALAYNGRDKAEVDAVLAEAVAAGGSLVKKAEDVFWGGYSGYFADPDGHLWEVAFNPFFPIAEDGSISLG